MPKLEALDRGALRDLTRQLLRLCEQLNGMMRMSRKQRAFTLALALAMAARAAGADGSAVCVSRAAAIMSRCSHGVDGFTLSGTRPPSPPAQGRTDGASHAAEHPPRARAR